MTDSPTLIERLRTLADALQVLVNRRVHSEAAIARGEADIALIREAAAELEERANHDRS